MSTFGVKMTPKILLPALRQYRHNDNSEFVFGFEHDKTCEIVAEIEAKLRNLFCEYEKLKARAEQAEAKLQELYDYIKEHSKDLPVEYSQLVDEHFWELGLSLKTINRRR